MDRAAFQHERRIEAPQAEMVEHARGKTSIVFIAVVFLTPSIEPPVHPGGATVTVHDEGRPNIAHPGIVNGYGQDLDVSAASRRRIRHVIRACDDGDGLESSDGASDGP